ncbi:hypothetical protein ACFW16_26935 [Inquilinus sp. NPDC058860]|uniref:hypothetical protein n=1 Tax=Inquilinus sp. NPDC058860 TaxID=3346652 RepID=UPI0036C4444F
MPERIVDLCDENGAVVTSYTIVLAGDAPDEAYESEALRMAAFDAAVPADRLAGLQAKVRS